MIRREWFWLAGATVCVTVPTSAADMPQAGDLGTVIAAARHDDAARAQDRFAPDTVDQSKTGKPFEVVIPFGNGDVVRPSGSSAFYSYDPDRGELKLVLSTTTVRAPASSKGGLSGLNYYDLIELGSRSRPGSSYIGQNAFGASARVSVRHDSSDGIVPIDRPGDGEGYRSYDIVLPLAGPAARAVAIDSVARISGTLALLDNGKLGGCATSYAEPKIDSPTEVFASYCFAGAKVGRIAFIRKSTGEVIKEWTIDDSPPSGPLLWKDIRYGMTKRQFMAAHPEIDWPKYAGQIEIRDGGTAAKLNIRQGRITSVDTDVTDQSPTELRATLLARYGAPIENRCEYIDNVCTMIWLTVEGAQVELRTIGSNYRRVEYAAADKPKW